MSHGRFLAGRGQVLLAVLPVLVLGALLLVDAETVALGLLSDDAFYYLKIARSISDGHGSSFDGLGPTNGYHPLWMLCMVGITSVAGADPVGPIVLSLLLAGLVCGGTLALLSGAVERWGAPGFGGLVIASFLSPLFLGAMTNGLETGILLLALAALLWCSFRYELLVPSAGCGRRFVLGLLLGLMFLCRLDSAFIVLSAGFLVLLSGLVQRVPLRNHLLGCLAMVAGVLVLATPYFAWNHASTGRFTPISGVVKSTFPELAGNLSLQGDMRFGLAISVLSLLFAVIVALVDIRRGRAPADVLCSPLSILALGALGHFLYTLLFMSWGVYWWHFVADGVALALGAAQVCDRLSAGRARIRRLAQVALPALVGALGLGAFLWLAVDKFGRHREWRAAAAWALAHTPPDSVFAMKDAGLFSYFSQRTVVNLDGKANSYAFLERLNRGEVLDYLADNRVSYIADINATYADGRAALMIPRARQEGQLIWMTQAREVYRGSASRARPFLDDKHDAAMFAIWSFGGGK